MLIGNLDESSLIEWHHYPLTPHLDRYEAEYCHNDIGRKCQVWLIGSDSSGHTNHRLREVPKATLLPFTAIILNLTPTKWSLYRMKYQFGTETKVVLQLSNRSINKSQGHPRPILGISQNDCSVQKRIKNITYCTVIKITWGVQIELALGALHCSSGHLFSAAKVLYLFVSSSQRWHIAVCKISHAHIWIWGSRVQKHNNITLRSREIHGV